MTAFARSLTRSWLQRLWPLTAEQVSNENAESSKQAIDVLEKQAKQNKLFFDAMKDGGFWFS